MTPHQTLAAIRDRRQTVYAKKGELLAERQKLARVALLGDVAPVKRIGAINQEMAALDSSLADLAALEADLRQEIEQAEAAAKQRQKANDLRYVHALTKAREEVCHQIDDAIDRLRELLGASEAISQSISQIGCRYESVENMLLFVQPPDPARVLWDRLSVLGLLPDMGVSNAIGNDRSFLFGSTYAQHGVTVRQRFPLVPETLDEPEKEAPKPLALAGFMSIDDAREMEGTAA